MSRSLIVRFLARLACNPYVWIFLAALAAQGASLWSDFYLDDYLFILQGDGTTRVPWSMEFLGMKFGNGVSGVQPVQVSFMQVLSTLAFDGIYWMFGPSPVAFHAANLLVHLVAACLVFRTARCLLRHFPLLGSAENNRVAAFCAALIFAVHPLCTEPVNYAKCLMLQMVVAFGLWLIERFLIQLERPSPANAAWLAVALAGTLLSYFPGAVVAFGGMGLILAGKWRGLTGRAALRQKTGALLVAALAAVAATPLLGGWAARQWNYTTLDHRWSHVLTQGRVFWMYLERVILPVDLCSDHFIAWSLSARDLAAALATAGVVLLTAGVFGTLVLAKSARLRAWSLVAALALTPLLYRFLYINHEAMVEYRTYPAMPWLCLLLGAGAAVLLARRRRVVNLAMAGALAVLALLSCVRSQVWHDHFAHCEDVLRQYPLNNRARAEIITQSFGSMDWDPIPLLVKEARAAKAETDAFNRSQTRRAYSTYLSTLPMVYIEHYHARYLSVTQGADAGLKRLDEAIALLQGTSAFAAFRGTPRQVVGIKPLTFAREDIATHREELDRFSKAWREAREKQVRN
ncbi:MAG: hypothetical protein KA004_15350 [Verrucomicrobiales bacterium]|nr:hypothetical protein [Verrucomicrobiales bacterium]